MEYVGRRSRYNKSAPPSTSVQLHITRSTLLDAGAGEDHANQKARLTEQLGEAKAAYDEIDQKIRAKRDEIRGIREQMQPLKDNRVALNKIRKTPDELATKIKMDKRHREVCKSKLTQSGESERTGRRQDFERCMDLYLKGLELSVNLGQKVLTRQVELAAAKHFVNVLEDELSDAKEVLLYLSFSTLTSPYSRTFHHLSYFYPSSHFIQLILRLAYPLTRLYLKPRKDWLHSKTQRKQPKQNVT